MENIVEFREVTKIYRRGFASKIALNKLDLTIKRGECVGFLGHNGAGKTTSIKSLLGFITPTSGSALIMGKSVMQTPEIKKKIAYIPENVRFHSHLTPLELFKFYSSLNGIEIDEKKIVSILEMVNLPKNILNNKISTFSKGMNQRLAIGMLELKESSVMILDEPTTGLDPAGRMMLKDIIRKRLKEGTTILISSHQLLDMEQLVDKVAILKQGKLLEFSSISTLRGGAEKYLVTFSGNNLNELKLLKDRYEIDMRYIEEK
jgi:ABC-type multidrug transport system ATPase subunit